MASGGSERIEPMSKALVATGESKTPFSQGLVPRKAPTMPKPEWHAPWKLMRVNEVHVIISFFLHFDSIFGIWQKPLLCMCPKHWEYKRTRRGRREGPDSHGNFQRYVRHISGVENI